MVIKKMESLDAVVLTWVRSFSSDLGAFESVLRFVRLDGCQHPLMKGPPNYAVVVMGNAIDCGIDIFAIYIYLISLYH